MGRMLIANGYVVCVDQARQILPDGFVAIEESEIAAVGAAPQTREIMQTELLRIWERGQKTVLFVTHQIDEAVFLSDRVLVFARRPGRLQADIKVSLPTPPNLGDEAN